MDHGKTKRVTTWVVLLAVIWAITTLILLIYRKLVSFYPAQSGRSETDASRNRGIKLGYEVLNSHFATHQNIFMNTVLDTISTSCSWTHFKWNLQRALQVFPKLPLSSRHKPIPKNQQHGVGRQQFPLLNDPLLVSQLLLVWYHRCAAEWFHGDLQGFTKLLKKIVSKMLAVFEINSWQSMWIKTHH